MQAIHYVEIGGFVAEAFGIWLLFSEVRLAHEFEKRHLLHARKEQAEADTAASRETEIMIVRQRFCGPAFRVVTED
jgi:hypothetical protein